MFKFVLMPLTLEIILLTIGFVAGVNRDLLWFIGNIGTLCYMMGLLLFLAILDSKKYWPNTNWLQRLSYILTFKGKDV